MDLQRLAALISCFHRYPGSCQLLLPHHGASTHSIWNWYAALIVTVSKSDIPRLVQSSSCISSTVMLRDFPCDVGVSVSMSHSQDMEGGYEPSV